MNALTVRRHAHAVEVDAQKRIGVSVHKLIRDAVADVSSLCAVLRVSQHLGHEPVPKRGRGRKADGFSFGLGRKTKSGHRRHDHIERVIRRAAKSGGIGKRPNRFEELEDRTRPAVREDQRHRLRSAPLHVIEVNIEIADARKELRVAIQVCFRFPPVKMRGPVFRKLLHVIPVGAVAPVARLQAIRPARLAHSIENAIDRRLRDVNAKRPRGSARDLRLSASLSYQRNAARYEK
jgi:hypothetical protein